MKLVDIIRAKEWERGVRDGRSNFSSVQSLSHVWLFETPWTMGLPVHHQLPEFTQTHIHWVSDAIQPSHSLSSPSPPTFNLSQHQGLFQWISSLHQVAKVLEFQLQHQSFQWIFGTDFLQYWFDLAVQGTLKILLQHRSSKEYEKAKKVKFRCAYLIPQVIVLH